MENNLGKYVKWQDSKDGGWRTGRIVILSDGKELEIGRYKPGGGGFLCYELLVQESCDYKLTWVNKTLLQDWVMRSEWEKDVEQQVILDQIERNYNPYASKDY